MLSSGNQNQFPSSLAPLGDLFKVLMFLLNLNGFNSSPSPPDQRFAQRKGSSKVWKEKGSKWFSHFFSLPPFFMHYLCVLLSCFWISLVFMICFVLTCFCLFVFSLIYFVFHKNKNKKLKNQKNSKIVCVCVFWYFCTLDGY